MSTLLCDIGNTTARFFDGEQSWSEPSEGFDPSRYPQTVYYLCVRSDLLPVLCRYENWIDLAPRIVLPGAYSSMGVDRRAVAGFKKSGVVVDAGSAVTVDVVESGRFIGGFIFPGLHAMQEAFASISDALAISLNFELSFDTMPNTTVDAVSYGAIVPLVEQIRRIAQTRDLLCTGGDGAHFARWLNAPYERDYIFNAMSALIEE